ncbi:hypothetical protein BRC94_00900 [Halobacteriales archaeon QS_5_70_17]|nr:MAG: hypothetical protein BRC94_00900 [Halobacteriales archaeon QS_5_70_17]
MDVEDTVRAYYEALRRGEPLSPFFVEGPDVVKFGISERLEGSEAVAEGLRAQTQTTDGWVVESSNLVAADRGDHGWFSDEVFMAWTDRERSVRYEFDTRWSGTLVRVEGGKRGPGDENDGAPAPDSAPGEWRFAGMHVSTAREGL